MELQIRANGIKVTDGLREFIDRRIAKLDRLMGKVIDAQLELKTETTRSGAQLTTAQLTLHTRRNVLRAEARDPEAAKAIDMAIDKLVMQVRRYSDKRSTRKRRAPQADYLEAASPVDSSSVDNLLPEGVPDGIVDEFEVARKKTFQMDPMGVETAIEQMELIGHDFFFFKNEDDEKFSVLYRRRDGTYGILSPE